MDAAYKLAIAWVTEHPLPAELVGEPSLANYTNSHHAMPAEQEVKSSE